MHHNNNFYLRFLLCADIVTCQQNWLVGLWRKAPQCQTWILNGFTLRAFSISSPGFRQEKSSNNDVDMWRPHPVGPLPRHADWYYWQALNIGQNFCHIIWRTSDLSDIIIIHSIEENCFLQLCYNSPSLATKYLPVQFIWKNGYCRFYLFCIPSRLMEICQAGQVSGLTLCPGLLSDRPPMSIH